MLFNSLVVVNGVDAGINCLKAVKKAFNSSNKKKGLTNDNCSNHSRFGIFFFEKNIINLCPRVKRLQTNFLTFVQIKLMDDGEIPKRTETETRPIKIFET